MMRRRHYQLDRLLFAAVSLCLVWGCAQDSSNVRYLGEPDHQYYQAEATNVAFPVTESYTEGTINSAAPRTIQNIEDAPLQDLTLAECLQTALQNSHIIRTGGTFLSAGNPLYNSPDRVSSIYDPALQESGVLFGNRGVEAALSAFDSQFTTSMIWGRNETVQNNAFFGGGLTPGGTLVAETGNFNAGLQKSFGNGGIVTLGHSVNYLQSNAAQLFPSAYSGNVQLQYQLPLLAGSGTEFTRIAGPIGQQFGGLTGVSQGVIIARINNDIALADFEAAVRNMSKDVEDAYWDLYLAYRNYHTAMTAWESALETWRTAQIQLDLGSRTRAEVAQARDQLFFMEAAKENSQSNIFTSEVRLRRLMGLPVNDGSVLRPIDEPVSAELVPDWYASMTEALTHRVELRRQKWNIKSLELQLRAANSLTRPRLDFISSYQVNGFGDHLLANTDNDVAGTPQGLNNFYETINQGNQTGWNLGLQMSMPVGFRSALTQVRNYEIRLAKAQRVLAEQEQEISHELAVAFQELARSYATAQTNMNRLLAASENVKYLEPNVREGDKLLDDLLRAQTRNAEAEVAYYQSLVDYNKALTNLQYRKGVLLEHNGIYLAEGAWTPEAYNDSDRRAEARAYAMDEPYVFPLPEPFASSGPVDGVYATVEEVAGEAPVEMNETQPTKSESSEVETASGSATLE